MPKTRSQKKEIIDALSQTLSGMKAMVVAQYTNLSIYDEQDLRNELIKEGAQFHVVKKTLFAQALAARGFAVPLGELRGTIGVAMSSQDEVVPARVMAKFGKGRENFSIACGVIAREEGAEVMSGVEVKQLAMLPSRDELIAKAVGSIAAPLSGLVNVLAGPLRGLVNSLDAVRSQKGS